MEKPYQQTRARITVPRTPAPRIGGAHTPPMQKAIEGSGSSVRWVWMAVVGVALGLGMSVLLGRSFPFWAVTATMGLLRAPHERTRAWLVVALVACASRQRVPEPYPVSRKQ